MKCKIKVVKKSDLPKGFRASKSAKPLDGEFILLDNQDGSFAVHGIDKAGIPVDISDVATLTASSDNTSVLTADPPVGMTDVMHAVAPGSANVAVQAIWNDGSVGPFDATLAVPVSQSATGGIVIGDVTVTSR
jgi:hypothetical protein